MPSVFILSITISRMCWEYRKTNIRINFSIFIWVGSLILNQIPIANNPINVWHYSQKIHTNLFTSMNCNLNNLYFLKFEFVQFILPVATFLARTASTAKKFIFIEQPIHRCKTSIVLHVVGTYICFAAVNGYPNHFTNCTASLICQSIGCECTRSICLVYCWP